MYKTSEGLVPKMLIALLLSSAMLIGGCDDGPAEDAGEAIDDAVDDIGDAFD
jgi:hypothetical protein